MDKLMVLLHHTRILNFHTHFLLMDSTTNDIKDGGDAVQAVDIVALINRPNDLPKEERERRAKDGEPAISDNVMRIALGKHRYGDPSISGTFGWDHGRIVPLGYSWVDWAEGYENGSRSSE